MDNTNSFTDSRGTIKDLFVNDEMSVTEVTFKKGAVRGNHYHKETRQIDFVMSGELTAFTGGNVVTKEVVPEGEGMVFNKGVPHAYKANKPSRVISICFGKRIGKNYEKDTFRLKTPLV